MGGREEARGQAAREMLEEARLQVCGGEGVGGRGGGEEGRVDRGHEA